MRKSLVMKKIVLILLLVAVHQLINAQNLFSKGVNLTGWFQTSSPRQLQFAKFTRQDFINIKSLGCDVIRLPINLHFMTNGSPDYVLDPIFLNFLDSAVTWAENLQIYLILDNHTFDPSVDTDPSVEGTLIKVWQQMAGHYKDRSGYILYEILNEPHGISDASWGLIQQHVIDAIREIDTDHTIVVGGAGWNSYNNLHYLPVYADNNLIYTFHFYDPFLFTHQGTSWTDPSMEPLSGIPFPYDADSMPELPSELTGTWIETSYNNYNEEGTVSKVKELLDIAIDFKNTRNVPVFCGEFGVYIPNSPHNDRVIWYDSVRTYLETNNIPWTIWDYVGSFGIFEQGGNDLFDYDLDTALVRALGMNVPPQEDFVIYPDSFGFPIYRDYIENKIIESSNAGTGTIDFYSENKPNNGNYCISWTGGAQYSTIGFDLKPNRDLSYLVDNNFALDLMIRGTTPTTRIDLRFLDTKTSDPDDHPWRIRYTIDQGLVEWNGKWNHLFLPLMNFTEQGSWDGSWYEPIGAYDWTAVDRFEIDAEYHSLDNQVLWFDNIHITNMDTARIYDTTAVIILGNEKLIQRTISLTVYPNPMCGQTEIFYTLKRPTNAEFCFFDLKGNTINQFTFMNMSSGNHSFTWYGINRSGDRLKPGVYYCRMVANEATQNIKIIIL
jgi:endoglucanase